VNRIVQYGDVGGLGVVR